MELQTFRVYQDWKDNFDKFYAKYEWLVAEYERAKEEKERASPEEL